MRKLIAASIALAAFAFTAPAFADCSGPTKTTAQSTSKPLTTTDSGVKTPIGTKNNG